MSQSRIRARIEASVRDEEQKSGIELENKATSQISQTTADAFQKFLRNHCKIEISADLSAEKEEKYRANLKRILSEEKVSEDKHEAIINVQVSHAKAILKKLSELTAADLLHSPEQDLNAKNVTLETELEEAGLPKEIMQRFGERLVTEDPLSQEIINLQTQKTLRLQLETSGQLEILQALTNDSDSDDEYSPRSEQVDSNERNQSPQTRPRL